MAAAMTKRNTEILLMYFLIFEESRNTPKVQQLKNVLYKTYLDMYSAKTATDTLTSSYNYTRILDGLVKNSGQSTSRQPTLNLRSVYLENAQVGPTKHRPRNHTFFSWLAILSICQFLDHNTPDQIEWLYQLQILRSHRFCPKIQKKCV